MIKRLRKFFTVGLIKKMIPLNASNVIFQNFKKDRNLILKSLNWVFYLLK